MTSHNSLHSSAQHQGQQTQGEIIVLFFFFTSAYSLVYIIVKYYTSYSASFISWLEFLVNFQIKILH